MLSLFYVKDGFWIFLGLDSISEILRFFSRQAQNDVAFFVESMTKTYEFTGPWIAFGGSYPGSMVAWAREKYPHLIKGGVSSSGPLLAKVKSYIWWLPR